MNLIPLGKRIIVAKPLSPEPKTASGILLSSEAAPEPENEAKVIAVGETVTTVKVGEVVVFTQYGFIEIEEEGQDYLIMSEEDLIAKRKK